MYLTPLECRVRVMEKRTPQWAKWLWIKWQTVEAGVSTFERAPNIVKTPIRWLGRSVANYFKYLVWPMILGVATLLGIGASEVWGVLQGVSVGVGFAVPVVAIVIFYKYFRQNRSVTPETLRRQFPGTKGEAAICTGAATWTPEKAAWQQHLRFDRYGELVAFRIWVDELTIISRVDVWPEYLDSDGNLSRRFTIDEAKTHGYANVKGLSVGRLEPLRGWAWESSSSIADGFLGVTAARWPGKPAQRSL